MLFISLCAGTLLDGLSAAAKRSSDNRDELSREESLRRRVDSVNAGLAALQATAARRARPAAAAPAAPAIEPGIEIEVNAAVGDAKRTELSASALSDDTYQESKTVISSQATRDAAIAAGLAGPDDDDNAAGVAPLPAPGAPLPTAAAAHPDNSLDYPDDDDDTPTPLPTKKAKIDATDIPTLIKQMQELLVDGHTPEAIGAAIRASGFDINGIRIGHYDTIGRKCALTGKAIQNWWRGGWRDLEKQDNGMNALQWAVFRNRTMDGGTPSTSVLPNAEKIIQALLAGGALPTVKVNTGRIFKGDAATNHGLDVLELALEHGSHETLCMMLKNHSNPVPVINHYIETCTGWHDIFLYAFVKGFPAAVIRQLFVCGAITPTHINRVITDAAPNNELSWFGVPVQYRKTPMTPICLVCWSLHYDQTGRLNVITVLAEYEATPDPRWEPASAEYQAWMRGLERRVTRPILNVLRYGDLRPTGGDSHFDPTGTSHSGPITDPAVRILPEAVTKLITDYI